MKREKGRNETMILRWIFSCLSNTVCSSPLDFSIIGWQSTSTNQCPVSHAFGIVLIDSMNVVLITDESGVDEQTDKEKEDEVLKVLTL